MTEELQFCRTINGVDIVSTRKQTNVNELFRAKKLKNSMFEKYRKITDWSFLTQKTRLERYLSGRGRKYRFPPKTTEPQAFLLRKSAERRR